MFALGDWRTALATLAMIPIMTVVQIAEQESMGLGDSAKGKVEANDDEKKSAGSLVGEAVSGIRTVASFNAEHRFFDTFSRQVDKIRDDALRRLPCQALFQATGQGLSLIHI